LITQYYTEYRYRPVREIAEASRTGPATNIISGLAVGLECTGLPVLTVSVALMGSYWCGKQALGGMPGAGLYGTAIATMGMLAPCAYILAMDTFGPITDNAGGIIEVRRQFKATPGIMKATAKPDYARCVDIVTVAALKEMVLPGFLAVLTPVAVGFGFKYLSDAGQIGAESVAALLMVGTIAGILMATVMNNGGGAWDNAKKYIESGLFKVDGQVVGKRSEPHKAAVVGDTVGDPFKDTAGPSLHVLIKLLSTITLVLAPLFIL